MTGKNLQDNRLNSFKQKLLQAKDLHIHKLQKNQTSSISKINTDLNQITIGIVGGGMTAMYAALLFEHLNINYTIFEAATGDTQTSQYNQLGGRVFTYYFNDNPHQYAELGAMRFPDNPSQSRLFNFWTYLNDTAAEIPNAKEIPQIPYILFDPTKDIDSGDLLCFNKQTPVTRNKASADNTLLGFDQYFTDPKFDYFKDSNGHLKKAADLLNNAITGFVSLFENEEIEIAWQQILEFNNYSAREFLEKYGDQYSAQQTGKTTGQPYPSEIVDYIEKVTSYKGIFDLALIEIILDNYSFSTSADNWFAMDGGTSRLTQEMYNRIPKENYLTGALVNQLSETDGKAVISCNGQSYTFDRVIVTVPLKALNDETAKNQIKIPSNWSDGKKQAIMSLTTINAEKVALGFSERFWESQTQYSERIAGGQSNTDLTSRSIVYPSFGIGESGPAYLLGSYSWNLDANEFIKMSDEEKLNQALQDVITLHGERAQECYLGHGASVVWSEVSYIDGGFAFFSKGQFGQEFNDARQPEGNFSFGGELLDIMHYWITGSFNSALRCVWETYIAAGQETFDNISNLLNLMNGGQLTPSMVPMDSTLTQEQLDELYKTHNQLK